MVCFEICGCRQQICCRLCLDLCGRASVFVSACNVENHKFVCAFSYMGERNELTETHICHSLFKYTHLHTHAHSSIPVCVQYELRCATPGIFHREFRYLSISECWPVCLRVSDDWLNCSNFYAFIVVFGKMSNNIVIISFLPFDEQIFRKASGLNFDLFLEHHS